MTINCLNTSILWGQLFKKYENLKWDIVTWKYGWNMAFSFPITSKLFTISLWNCQYFFLMSDPTIYNINNNSAWWFSPVTDLWHGVVERGHPGLGQPVNVYQWYSKLINNIYTILQRGISLKRPWRVGADRLPWCWHICLSIGYRSGIGIEIYGQYVSSWWWPVWLRYWLYMICSQMSNWDDLWLSALYGQRLSSTGWQKWLTHSKSIILMCLQ